ncbi:hypothetical protein PVK06_035210 [Gossypium arboreum]|uniref:Uncharacterized protein n=1 Tax=Gossypium arboreum TaxID=29729 RepID=A0ABR0NG80_GOSAR|nr:hypothetical protein PVK06_035210 [Gossypium arboreum]
MKRYWKIRDPINEASIERMTHCKEMQTMKEAETGMTRKGKTKVEIIVGQEVSTVEEEVAVEEENIHAKFVNENPKEENIEIEAIEKEFVENIVNASDFMDTNNENLSLSFDG